MVGVGYGRRRMVLKVGGRHVGKYSMAHTQRGMGKVWSATSRHAVCRRCRQAKAGSGHRVMVEPCMSQPGICSRGARASPPVGRRQAGGMVGKVSRIPIEAGHNVPPPPDVHRGRGLFRLHASPPVAANKMLGRVEVLSSMVAHLTPCHGGPKNCQKPQ